MSYEFFDSINEASISSSAKLTAYILFSYRNKKTGECYPSIRTLAENANMSSTTIMKALKELEKSHIITTKRIRRSSSNINSYSFHVPVSDTSTDTWTGTSTDTPVDTPVDMSVTGTEHKEHKEQKKTKQKKVSPIKTDLPNYIKEEVWDNFVLNRKKMKKEMSDYAKKLMLGKVEKFNNQGYDVNDMMNNSILNGWQDVFIPKDSNYQFTKPQRKIKEI